ncbi:MAG: CoA transferase [Gammaproteobacteria bacterium]|nr:CoA transferase [Gammaproteobacteria bacterium]MCY4279014.1 CoA transferase [Gammaproteobacteria bacterium]
MSESEHTLPLAGITIVEFASMITASLASMMAAEQGARVIKVEPPMIGDMMRHMGSSKGGASGLFANCNRGKESVVLDLKSTGGIEAAKRIVAGCDVLITNYRPGVMDKLGLGSDDLRRAYPRLVYLAVTGFGVKGPLKDVPAYDPIIQAQAGFTFIQGRETPELIQNLVCDKVTALTACQALTAALLHRERTGQGQHIDLSMLDAGLFFMFPDGFMNHTLLDDDVNFAPELRDALSVVSAKNGFLTISAATPRQRFGLHRAIGQPNLSEDERFASIESLLTHFEAYTEILQRAFASFDIGELIERLHTEGVPAGKCLTREAALDQAQVAVNESIEVTQHAHMGGMRQVRSPARFAGRPLALASDCPQLGEHTEAILREFAP